MCEKKVNLKLVPHTVTRRYKEENRLKKGHKANNKSTFNAFLISVTSKGLVDNTESEIGVDFIYTPRRVEDY